MSQTASAGAVPGASPEPGRALSMLQEYVEPSSPTVTRAGVTTDRWRIVLPLSRALLADREVAFARDHHRKTF